MNIVNRPAKKPLIITVCILLPVGAALVWMYSAGIGPFASRETPQELTPSQKEANSSDTTNPTSKEANASATPSDDVDTSKTTDQIPVSNDVSVSITNLTYENGNVTYQAAITNSTGGTCSAVFTNEIGKPVTRNTEANGASCGPVIIPDYAFDAIGTWKLTLRYYSNDHQATDSKDIEVR